MLTKENILSIPLVYQLWQALIGYFGLTRLRLYANYLPYTPGLSVLDLGCGPGSATRFFNKNDYLGLDISQDYIHHAIKKYPDHKFKVDNFLSNTFLEQYFNSFDLIFAMGLLHHLDNKVASQFLSQGFKLLRNGGNMICFDGCTHVGQTKISRMITLADRGKYIRTPQAYVDLASNAGFQTRYSIERRAYAIPYGLIVLSLKK